MNVLLTTLSDRLSEWALFERKEGNIVFYPRNIFCFLLIVLAFVNTIGGQYMSFWTTTDVKMHEQLYAPVLDRLKELPYGTVLTSTKSEPYHYLVTIYTKDDLYFSGGGLEYYMPLQRIEDALLIALYLNRDARPAPRAFLEKEITATSTDDGYTQLYQYIEGEQSGLDFRTHRARYKKPDTALLQLRAKLLTQIEADYKKTMTSPEAVKAILVQQDVKYILWDKSIEPAWDVPVLPGVKIIYDKEPITLYGL